MEKTPPKMVSSPSYARFADYMAQQAASPQDLLTAFRCEMEATAASVGAKLDGTNIELDGKRHDLRSMNSGKKNRYYRASIERDPDGTTWPCVTFGDYGSPNCKGAFFKPRNLMWQRYLEQRSNRPCDNAAVTGKVDPGSSAMGVDALPQDYPLDSGPPAPLSSKAVAAVMAQNILQQSEPASCAHPYLKAKGVASHGVFTLAGPVRVSDSMPIFVTGDLVIPLNNDKGETVNIELIRQKPNGKGRYPKYTLPGGQKSGCSMLLGDVLPDTTVILIAEGYATAATLHEALGVPVVCSFGTGNLKVIAEQYARATGLTINVAADNDPAGIEAGQAAADAVAGLLVIPPAPGDWNDYANHSGRASIEGAIANIIELKAATQEGRPCDASVVSGTATIGPNVHSSAESLGDADVCQLKAWTDTHLTSTYKGPVERPDLGKDSKVAAYLAEPLSNRFAICVTEDELYQWSVEGGFWQPSGTTVKKMERITHVAMKAHYGDIGFSSGKVASVAKMLTFELPEIPEPNCSYIVFRNGTLNPRSGEFQPCDVKELYARYSTGVEYYQSDGREEDCPEFLRFLGFAAGGESIDDRSGEHGQQRIDKRLALMKAVCLMILQRRYDWQMFVEVVGSGGTGKSTFAAVLGLLVGAASIKTIEARDLEVPERRADIANAALLYMPDMESYQGEAAGLKKITGGDPVSCRRLYGASYTTYIRAVILAANNTAMRFTDKGGAIARRRVLIKLDHVVPPELRDQGLVARICHEIPAVIQYLLKWQRELGGQGAVKRLLMEATNGDDIRDVLIESDPITGFASCLYYHDNTHCLVGGTPSERQPAQPRERLFHAYLAYCRYYNYQAKLTQRTFSEEFLRAANRFGTVRRSKLDGRSVFRGVGIVTPSKSPPEWIG